MVYKDQLGRLLDLEKIPERIISLVPSQTELLISLGLERQLVGVTKFCVHPAHIRRSKTVVGGTKSVHYEKIRALDPDIILCNKEENTLEMVRELEKIAPVQVSDVIEFRDALELMQMYGELFGKQKESSELIKAIIRRKQQFENFGRKENLRVAYFIWRKPWMVAGGDTFINTLLKLNGWINVFEEGEGRYPEVKLEEVISLKPDIMLFSSEPFPFAEKHLAEVPDHFPGEVKLVDGEYFSWYGSRLLPALDYFEDFHRHLSRPL